MTTATAREYQRTSPEDQRDFDKWINSNAILSSIFAIGVLAMALAAIVVHIKAVRMWLPLSRHP